ncbi:hypothetical protein [Halomonas sp. Mc5H-6]|uniref:hypothetical protein n=1 Tax=Halomonas sp. Mc5H-6 TaxID=2954500 RepID=UPI002097B4EB|nr:hypothetical protein [Halomonas sp. Mc5H-6]MCO7246354.1 hypothetical protein [Halomonas sp. Mc5H-6]
MSVRSLGRLTLDLVLETGNFLGPMDKAGRRTKRQTKQISDDFKKVAGAVTAVAAASAAGATALIAFTDRAAQNARGLTNQAQLANATVEEFQRMAYGVREVNIEEEKLADILKDVNDRVGDFLREGGGPMASFFENVAPKIGLTAEAFKGLSGPEALQLYYDSLEKANVSQQEMTTYLEEMASDTTALIPLLRNGGERLGEMADEADQLGIVMSELEVAQLSKVATELDKGRALVGSMGDALAIELAPFVLALAEDFSDAAKEAGDMQVVVQQMVDTSVDYLGAFLDAVWDIDTLIQTAGVSTREFALVIARSMASATTAILEGPVDALNFLIEQMNNVPGIDVAFVNQPDFTYSMREQVEALEGALKNARFELDELAEGVAPSERLNEFIRQAREAAAAIEVEPPTKKDDDDDDDDNKPTKEEQEAIDAINKQVDALKLQVETLGMASDAAALYEMAQEGATTKQLAAARAALETISAYEESEKAADDYQKLLEDLRTTEEQLTDQMHERLAVLDAVNVASDEYADIAGKIAAASFEDAPEYGGLDASIGGAFGELAKIDEAEEELQQWYDTQLEMLEQFRQERSDLNAEWDEQERALKQEHEDELARIEDARMMARLSAAEGAFGDMADVTKTFAGEQSDIYKTMFAAEKAFAIASSIMAIQEGIARAARLQFPANIPAMATVAAETAGIVSTIQSVSIDGQAHDGIMSVPEDGTWNLKKGERVTTAETSAKMDATLARLERDTEPRGDSGGVNFQVAISVDAKPGMSAEESRRQGQQMGKAFRNEVLKIMQNEKRQGGLLSS